MSSMNCEGRSSLGQKLQRSVVPGGREGSGGRLSVGCFEPKGDVFYPECNESAVVGQGSDDSINVSGSSSTSHWNQREPQSANPFKTLNDGGTDLGVEGAAAGQFSSAELELQALMTGLPLWKSSPHSVAEKSTSREDGATNSRQAQNRTTRFQGNPSGGWGAALPDAPNSPHSRLSHRRKRIGSLAVNPAATPKTAYEESCETCDTYSTTRYVSVSLGLSDWEAAPFNRPRVQECFGLQRVSAASPCTTPPFLLLTHGHKQQAMDAVLHEWRRKRIKRVNEYILGPILGEGVLGTVRDAINISSNNAYPFRFQRVAVKCYKRCGVKFERKPSVSLPLGSSSLGSAKKRHEDGLQRLREAERRHLQCFYSTNVVRSIDAFSHNGKQYVVLPAAICNLDQLVQLAVYDEHYVVRNITRDNRVMSPSRVMEHGEKFKVLPSFEGAAEGSFHSETDGAVSGQNTRQSPTRERVTPPIAAGVIKGIMNQVLRGVAYLHRQGVAHNDLKPQNILLFADGLVKVSDLASVSVDYNGYGTPMYLSPEVCKLFYAAGDDEGRGGARVDPFKNDMWSCGAILYYLLTGKTLWEREGECQTVYQLYRLIAAQSTPIDLSYIDVPDEGEGVSGVRPSEASSNPFGAGGEPQIPYAFPPFSLLHLAAGLLDIDPTTRLTAEQAVQHPSLQIPTGSDANTMFPVETTPQDLMRLTLESSHYQGLIRRDRERHLQFTVECCYVLNVDIPETVYSASSRRTGADGDEQEDSSAPLLRQFGKLGYMFEGTVDPSLFLPANEFHYYSRKLNNPGCDVVSVSTNSANAEMMKSYLHAVMAECGCAGHSTAGARECERSTATTPTLFSSELRGMSLQSLASPKSHQRSKTPGNAVAGELRDNTSDTCCAVM